MLELPPSSTIANCKQEGRNDSSAQCFCGTGRARGLQSDYGINNNNNPNINNSTNENNNNTVKTNFYQLLLRFINLFQNV